MADESKERAALITLNVSIRSWPEVHNFRKLPLSFAVELKGKSRPLPVTDELAVEPPVRCSACMLAIQTHRVGRCCPGRISQPSPEAIVARTSGGSVA